jgi:transcriptional regulator with XRE-family HTH domain
MGSARRKPKKLARKLLAIRRYLQLSQSEMARALHLKTSYTVISAFETGRRQPDLFTLAQYAKLAGRGVAIDTLIDDRAALPARFSQ